MANIRYGLAAALETLQAHDPDLSVYPYMHMSPSAPAMCVALETWDPQMTMGPHDARDYIAGQMWRVWILLNEADWVAAQTRLDRYLDNEDDWSIYKALEGNPTLPYEGDDTVSYVRVIGLARMPSEIQGPAHIAWGGLTFMGCAITIKVEL